MHNKLVVFVAIAVAGLAQAQVKPDLPSIRLSPGSVTKAPSYPVTFHVPVQVKNIPSDIDNVSVSCRINAPGKHWDAASPVHLSAGQYNGTITVQLNLPEALPYDAKWDCSLNWGRSIIDQLESVRGAHPDPAAHNVTDVNGSF